MNMASSPISHVCFGSDGVYLSYAHDPDASISLGLAEALLEHARCVRCNALPRLVFYPCPCEGASPDRFSGFFDFRVETEVWTDLIEPLWRRDQTRIASRDKSERRREELRRSEEPAYTRDDVDCLRRIQNASCYYCGGSIQGGFHVEHLEPLCHGGSNGFRNIMLACPSCNSDKGTLNERQYWKKIQKRRSPAKFERLRAAAKAMKIAKWQNIHRSAAGFSGPVRNTEGG